MSTYNHTRNSYSPVLFDCSDEGNLSPYESDKMSPTIPRARQEQTPVNLTTESSRRQLFDMTNTSTSQALLILDEVKKSNSSLLAEFQSRMSAIEDRLVTVENSQQKILSTPSSADSSSGKATKRKVPAKVRNEVRTVYKNLLDNEVIDGFDLKKRYTDKENQEVVAKLSTEMKSLDASVTSSVVRDAARRFFQSKLQEMTLKEKGKYDDKVKRTRQRNRINRKLDVRMSTLMKLNVPENQRKFARELSGKILCRVNAVTWRQWKMDQTDQLLL